MHTEMDRIRAGLEAIRQKTDFVPEVAIVLGSGLGGFADEIRQVAVVDYKDIPGFPVSTAPGHVGRFVFGYVNDTPVACMQGRIHLYEGYAPQDAVLPHRLLHAMGARILFLTNAAGSLRPEWGQAGVLMMIKDHISTFVPSPIRGPVEPELGVRFPDMGEVYNKRLCAVIRAAAEKNGIDLHEGVYVQFPGPAYETPAEVRMAGILGADAVGMSTAIEALAANHCGMKVCGIACLANLAAGLTDEVLTEQGVIDAANATAPRFRALVWDSVAAMHGMEF